MGVCEWQNFSVSKIYHGGPQNQERGSVVFPGVRNRSQGPLIPGPLLKWDTLPTAQALG